MKQQSLASLTYAAKKKQTKREKFLNEMDQVVPWSRLVALIEPHYPKVGKGRRPMPLAVMLRIYCLQQWYGLSDPAVEESLYDMESMRRFAGLERVEDAIPDETTILKFRHLLEQHRLTDALFEEVKTYLQDQGLLLAGGSSVDAKSGLIHTLGVTTAKTHDAKVIDPLIREDDQALFGDTGYVNEKHKTAARQAGVYSAVIEKAKPKKKLSASQHKRNKKHAAVRSKVEHIFRIIKCQFSYRKTRYRGLQKNADPMFSLMALANLYQARNKLMRAAG